jgi:hypothetical protein
MNVSDDFSLIRAYWRLCFAASVAASVAASYEKKYNQILRYK